MNPDLELALSLADAADAITLRHFQSATLAVRTKVDMTPVSEADEAVERVLRELLAARRPGDAIVGEEYGTSGASPRRWILDPIDATKNYVRGIPVYATLIGLVDGDRPVVGVVSAPALSRRWWASAGDGAFCRRGDGLQPVPGGLKPAPHSIQVSRISDVAEAHIAYDSVTDFDQAGSTEKFLTLMRRCTRARGFGDFWIHMLVAEGAIEIAVEPAVAPWDMAAVQVIVEEAGGRFSDLRGNARFDGGSGLSTNGLLHDEVLESFR
ncbi:MAG TPA: inositol monophosphatase family protein [Thermoanaerobaculia bacterium]|nr:inositol monophosphatase family protein [Thermoanaerobaculia bacterium]